MIPAFVDKSKIPHKSGVYIYKDSDQEVLYVGKAIDLFSRVNQYFSTKIKDTKTKILVSNIRSIETIIVESDFEALILEANLIKKYLPPFNIRLTDAKDYLYIIITIKEKFPRIITGRKKDVSQAYKSFGPFPSAKIVRNTLKQLRKVFPWCANQKYNPCFYYHLGLCPGACTGGISQKDYKKIINRFIKLMEGKKEQLVAELIKEMEAYAKSREFEEASKIKNIIQGIFYLTSPNRTQIYLENPNFLEEESKLALESLKRDLKLERLPERIEGYDISNIQGREASGSMAVLTDGEADKSQYRKFKIRIAGRPNDVGMHKEMIKRRLRHTEWPLPDLILVDGGIAQAKAINFQLSIFNYQIPVYGLAKRLEWLYSPGGEIVKLPVRSLSLKLLQKLRDEAHRFAISYHRKLRDRAFLGGVL